MKKSKFKIHFFITFLCISAFSASAQNSPEELGRLVFEAFKKDSAVDISKLESSFEEAKLFTKKIGLPFDSVGYYRLTGKRKMQAKNIKEYKEKNFNWSNVKLDSIEKTEFEFPVDWSQLNSKSITLANIFIYLSTDQRHFLLRLYENPKIDQEWKLGGNILFFEY